MRFFTQEVWELPRAVDRIVSMVIDQVTGDHSAMVGPLGPVISELVKAGVDCQVAALRVTRLLKSVESMSRGLERGVDD